MIKPGSQNRRQRRAIRHENTVHMLFGGDGDAARSIVSATALGGLLSVVSTSTLNHGHLVVSSSALFVVSTATFLRNSACRGVVTASSDGHLKKKSWIKNLKEINVEGWMKTKETRK